MAAMLRVAGIPSRVAVGVTKGALLKGTHTYSVTTHDAPPCPEAGFAGTAWLECDSWYRNDSGRIVTNWPGYMRDYARRATSLDIADYDVVHPTG